MNYVRRLLLTDTRDRWIAIRSMLHATMTEKQLAEVMIEECNVMLGELAAANKAKEDGKCSPFC